VVSRYEVYYDGNQTWQALTAGGSRAVKHLPASGLAGLALERDRLQATVQLFSIIVIEKAQ
jgi:hypothetical protein